MLQLVKDQFQARPWWMNGLLFFCLYMTLVYVPWDLFIKPLSEDQEVWFGILFTGWQAKVGALLHWFVYSAGSYGFWHMRHWMHPWAALYVLQIALSMFVWSVMNVSERGLGAGTISALLFAALALALWRAQQRFHSKRADTSSREQAA